LGEIIIKKSKLLNIPNILSLLRLLLSFLLFYVWNNRLIVFPLLLFIGLTDIFDGYIARKYNQKTIIGACFDAIADFVFFIMVVLCSIIYEIETIMEIKYFILIIISLKILSIIICLIKYRKLGFLHTLGNKFTGVFLFVGICHFVLSINIILIYVGVIISIVFSFEELLINIIGKKYNENITGIYEIILKK